MTLWSGAHASEVANIINDLTHDVLRLRASSPVRWPQSSLPLLRDPRQQNESADSGMGSGGDPDDRCHDGPGGWGKKITPGEIAEGCQSIRS